VPAHDERDFEFAKQYGLPIRIVIQPKGGAPEAPFTVKDDSAVVIESDLINGLTPPAAIEKIGDEVERRGIGKKSVRYRLRDWLISRQRYWGTPIPMVYCDRDGIVPVRDEDLPVELPLDVPFTGREGNPLAKAEMFVNTTCPKCGGPAKRETDTMDTFVDSSWYYARFISPRNESKIFDSKLVDRWLPVDQYIGGIEHAILHLLYARFICRTLYDMKLVDFEEPFTRLFNQGVITKEGYRDPAENMGWVALTDVEWRDDKAYKKGTNRELVPEVGKMSKSRFNVVPPDELIERFGADTERVYTLFIAPPDKEAAWSDEGVIGAYRFLGRVWAMGEQIGSMKSGGNGDPQKMIRKTHQTIAAVTSRIERFDFNTAISALMELSNTIGEYLSGGGGDAARHPYESLLQLLHPFAPHMTEEMWSLLGHRDFILLSRWPEADPKLMAEDVVTIVVQVNGKLRGQIEVANPPEESVVLEAVRANERVQQWLQGKQIVKTIYVPGKLVNVVVR